jgi:hypothetical protein
MLDKSNEKNYFYSRYGNRPSFVALFLAYAPIGGDYDGIFGFLSRPSPKSLKKLVKMKNTT